MGVFRMGLFNQFTGFDFLFTLVGLGFWVSYLIWKERAIIFVLGEKWKKSNFRNFLAKALFRGWMFFGGLVLGVFPDMFWVGAWKTVLLLIVLFVIYTKSGGKKKEEKEEKTEAETGDATA